MPKMSLQAVHFQELNVYCCVVWHLAQNIIIVHVHVDAESVDGVVTAIYVNVISHYVQ